ncbi:hypothetical protein [Zoogloea sp.]|uniref:hypothetical protein n=1 Tax=Zoogloea sp. TaxID=49181 RepID=UPI0026051841|nr:hypothetical protein [Zoogloea sp.]
MQTPKLLRATPGLRTGNVRIGSTHAYSFNGDQVRLDAELLADAPASLSGRDWALQLWACAAPFSGHPTAGTLVAQIPLDTLIAEPLQYVGAETPGFPPAGHGSHAMVLVLAAGHDGCFDEVHDYANYPLAESFTQPEINGNARFELGDKTVTLSADGVTNPRAADNLSGTLSLELWALASSYTGGTPAGVQPARQPRRPAGLAQHQCRTPPRRHPGRHLAHRPAAARMGSDRLRDPRLRQLPAAGQLAGS